MIALKFSRRPFQVNDHTNLRWNEITIPDPIDIVKHKIQTMFLLFSISLIFVLFQALSSATYPYYAAAAAAAAAAAGVAGVGGVGGVGGAGQLGYWYPPQSYPTTATQMQAGGFLQGMQGYTYGQFAGYQQAQYMG